MGATRSRLEGIERIIVVAEVLCSRRLGARLEDIHEAACERIGTTWCERTTLRNLKLLEQMNLAEREEGRWRYRGRQLLPTACRPVEPRELSELRDANELLREELRRAERQLAKLQPPKPARVLPMLSTRQRDILALLGNGLSSAEIAERLGISHYTVDTHRWRIRKRLGIISPDGLLRLAIENTRSREAATSL